MRRRDPARRGVAAVELAVLLPVLTFLFVISIDWARIYYFSVTLTNVATRGALYLTDPVRQKESQYTSVEQAALADATNLSPAPKVTVANGSDANGSYADVTATWTFATVTNFPGVPSPVTLTRKVRVRLAPAIPD
jgi:Flp pilus assembly protein TadG